MQKNAIFLFSGVIALTSAFLFFALDVYKEANKSDVSFLLKDSWFNHGVQICLICLPIISTLTYILAKRETGNFNENVLSGIRLFTFGVTIVDIIGIHCIISPIRVSWYGKQLSIVTFSIGGLVLAVIVYLIFNALSKKITPPQ